MKKLIGCSIPLLAACLLLGVLFHFVHNNQHVNAASARSSPVGTILVNTLEDEQAVNGKCSLREAVQAANTNTAIDSCPAGDVITDTINFNVIGVITVTSQLSVTAGGPLLIDGGDVITTSGGGTTRVWWVEEGSVVILQGLAVVNGYLANDSGAGLANHHGTVTISDSLFLKNNAWICGGMNNQGTLSIISSSFYENRDRIYMGGGGGLCNGGKLSIDDSDFSFNQGNEGSGITNSGILTITNSIISENTAYFGGGGINNKLMGTMTISNSILWGNSAGQGGGIINDGDTVIIGSTIAENTSGEGGGIDNRQSLTIRNSTLTGNSVGSYGHGGGINNDGSVLLQNSTISGNLAVANLGMGGGINNDNGGVIIHSSTLKDNSSHLGGYAINNEFGFGQITLSNSIVTGPFINCSGTIIDGGHNIENYVSCGFNPANDSMPNRDPMLGPLQDNGGPTWTHALLTNSPAIDNGDDDLCPPTDQRGLPRPMNGNWDGIVRCDIGSYEVQVPIIPPYFMFLPTVIR